MVVIALASLLLGTDPAASPNGPPKPLQFDAATIVYVDAPATMPKGTQWAILEGDPKAAGIFTLRLKAPKGFALPMHTHPVDERVTVIDGKISVAFEPGKAKARTFAAGAFYVNPPGLPHHVFCDDGCTVQITGMGPWKVDVIKADAPQKR